MLKAFHNRFRHAEPYFGLLIASGFFTWVSKEAEVFGVDTWSEAVLLGSAFGIVAMFALAAVLIGWRIFRPLPQTATATGDTLEATATLGRAPPYDDSELRNRLEVAEQGLVALADLEARFTAFDSNNTAILRHYNKMQDAPDRLTKLEEAFRTYAQGELDRLKPIIDAASEALEAGLIAQSQVRELGQSLGSSQTEVAKSILAAEAQVSLGERYTRQQVMALYQALTAIGHLETARDLANEIEAIGDRLATPTTENAELGEGDWENWEITAEQWDKKLRAWCDLVSAYRDDMRSRVLTVSEESLKQAGVAKSSQFPTAEAYIAYKAFAIRRVQFAGSRQGAEHAIMEVAFHGGGATERPVK